MKESLPTGSGRKVASAWPAYKGYAYIASDSMAQASQMVAVKGAALSACAVSPIIAAIDAVRAFAGVHPMATPGSALRANF